MRLPAMILAGALALAATAAFASVTQVVTARLAAPVAETNNAVVAAGAVWNCEGTVCVARMERRTPVARDCRMLAREVGQITEFSVGDLRLDAAGLETCNRSAR